MSHDDGSGYRVDLGALAQFADQLSAFDRVAERRGADMDHRMAQLHEVWSGADAAAHQTNHLDWTEALSRMRKVAKELEDAARLGHHNYTKVVEHNQRMWP